MKSKKQLGSITLLVEDRQTHAKDMNQILSEAGHIIMARLGVNIQPLCLEHCTGLVVVVVTGTTKEINDLTKKLNELYGIVAKSSIVTR